MALGAVLASLGLPLRAADADLPALKDVFAGKFLVGTALGARTVLNPEDPTWPLIESQFNSISPGNLLKWERYNPEPGVYREEPVEAFLRFAEANHQHVLGHVLFWHQQTPAWVFQDENGGQVSREVLLERMRQRVRHLAQRYGSRINTWDVINETFEDDGALRDSPWTKILGADFIPEAFRIANEELPADVELIYNDYNMFAPGKRAAVVQMIHDLRAQGLRIDGVGMQGHWALQYPALDAIEASIVAFGAAGVQVHVTELDLDVLPRDRSMYGADVSRRMRASPENNPYTAGLPAEVQEKLARRYAAIFALFVKHADVLKRVTFWGVTDADSWLNNWPVRGRTNYPLLFDREGNPKPAFDAVVAVGRAGF